MATSFIRINANLLLFDGRTIWQLENVIFIGSNLFVTEPSSVLSKITVNFFFHSTYFQYIPGTHVVSSGDDKDGPHPVQYIHVYIIYFIYLVTLHHIIIFHNTKIGVLLPDCLLGSQRMSAHTIYAMHIRVS